MAGQRLFSYTNNFDQVESIVKGEIKIKMKIMIPQATKDFVKPNKIIML